MEMPREFNININKEVELNDKIMRKLKSSKILDKIIVAGAIHQHPIEKNELVAHTAAVIAALVREGSLVIKEKM